MQDPVLTLAHVSKSYGSFTAVHDISLQIPRGTIYGFLGPNGAGKTTTLRMVLDIIRPTSGEITVLGHRSALEVRHRIGYLPEEKGLYKKMKVTGLITYFARLKGMPSKAARERAEQLLQQYGLSEFGNSRVEALSKGMAQKVQVLASVAHDPELVILDEPFSGLDPINQQVLEGLIRSLAEKGQTVIFSTHVMEHAERLCDQIVLINKGRVVFDGTVVQARTLIPQQVVLETTADLAGLEALDCVAGISRTGSETADGACWTIQMPNHAHPQEILRYCFDNGISLSRFEYAEPRLHDVFVQMVGDSAARQVTP